MTWLRLSFALCAAALAFFLASRAEAAAPRCDSRGAITFGPPPKLEEPSRSVDVAPPGADCLDAILRGDSYERGRAPAPPDGEMLVTTMPADPAALVPPLGLAPEPLVPPPPLLHEWRMTLERPPRA
jgi:hypothetical protein